MIIFGILCIAAAVILGYALNELGRNSGPMMEGVIPGMIFGVFMIMLFIFGVILLIGGLVRAVS